MAMVDIGEKHEAPSDVGVVEKYYPSIQVPAEKFPYLLEKEVGDECILIVRSKITRESTSDSEEHKEHSFTLELQEMRIFNPKEKRNKKDILKEMGYKAKGY